MLEVIERASVDGQPKLIFNGFSDASATSVIQTWEKPNIYQNIILIIIFYRNDNVQTDHSVEGRVSKLRVLWISLSPTFRNSIYKVL